MRERDHNDIADGLNRLVKLAMDTGEAESLEDAHKLFAGYRLAVVAGDDVGRSPTHQAALLTIVNAGRRSLLGGIEVEGIEGMDLLVPVRALPFPRRSRRRTRRTCGPNGESRYAIGSDWQHLHNRRDILFSVRSTFEGWAAGIVPLGQGTTCGSPNDMSSPPAGRAGRGTGGYRSFSVFTWESNQPRDAGKFGLSLWCPELHWQRQHRFGPSHRETAGGALADWPRQSGPGLSLDTRHAALRERRTKCRSYFRISTS